MISTDLIQGRTYLFDVVKEASQRKYFTVRTEDGVEFKLLKFKFQLNQPVPDFIKCYVKSRFPNIILGQDIIAIIKRFYTEGHEYDFIVKADKFESDHYYELEDANGLCFKLFNAPLALVKGAPVKCRVSSISGMNVSLQYVGKLAFKIPLKFFDIYQWLTILGIRSHHEQWLRFLEGVDEFAPCLDLYDEEDPMWILELLKAAASNITEWLISCKDNRKELGRVCRRMGIAKKIALYILEGSDYLRSCNPEQRTMIQDRLSSYVEQFTQYGIAAEKILNNSHEEYIDNMFARLKDAGYLYHPAKQFRIMMTILKLRPELINSRMGELYEALHSWDISNWKSDPFRPALIEQLQIFIQENSAKINNLPANDTSEDNKAIVRIILAIAVQRLLSTDSDKIDLDLNRAMLYRYISYLNPSNIKSLLAKGLDSLLGIEINNEFAWSDTDHPTLLFEKCSHLHPEAEGRDVVTKTYSSSKAEVKLTADNLQIIANNADPDETSIPNELFDWPATTISLSEPLQTKNIRKSKDLNVFTNLWSDISWSIFGEETDSSEPVQVEKRLPYGGEEVKVVIDGFRVLDKGPEKQRVQFHCTICDELYRGEGWMPCDTIHMLGWLSYKDIPSNYDGSLDFACNRDGQPLIYNATVHKRYDRLEFKMKEQIDNFLLETASPDTELVAIVTYFDRINNAWLCLSEMGSTFKVPKDESTAGLTGGRLVRVRYVEPERSSSLTQFFIGELSENQSNLPTSIKKSLCLYNLMQALGEDPCSHGSDNLEVRETEEVMSREELIELIHIYQRIAYSETEYLKAFNYLNLAALLSRIAEEPNLHKEISTHIKLLILLQDFGKNQKVDTEMLLECETDVKDIPMLERIYTRLKIVADLNLNDNSSWLWDVANNPRNEIEGKLASLVLSYNMLPEDLDKSRKEIMKGISSLLNINNSVSNAKYYGDESQTVEFKSSVIFSSRGGSRPDVRIQLHEIVHILCGFMNARGGTLYIGVNDSGYECGLNDDLAYRRAHGLKATLDGVVVDLQNHLDRVLPSFAKDHCEISIDPESQKGVIIVKVTPVETPVELDGILYVRASSTTKPRFDKEREEFIKNRKHNYMLQMKMLGIETSTSSSPTDNQQTHNKEQQPEITGNGQKSNQDVDSVPLQTAATQPSPTPTPIPLTRPKAKTGIHRTNVLHYYNSNFTTPSYYLYLNRDNTFFISSQDIYYEDDTNCVMALAVKENETDDYMIIGYEDGNVAKLPMSEVSKLSSNEYENLRDGKLVEHINIGREDDYLLSVLRASYGEIFYRIDRLSDLPTCDNFNDNGCRLCDNPHTIIAQDIVSSGKLTFFNSDAIGKEKRFYGVSVPNEDGLHNHEERINSLLRPLIPEE